MQGFTRYRIAPAFAALLVQLAAGLVVFALVLVMSFLARALFNIVFTFPVPVLVLMQSSAAVLLSYRLGMQKWWYWIQFFFPILIVVVLHWQLPPSLYLVAFLISLSLFWTTFSTQVPFYPSHRLVWPCVLDLLPHKRESAIRLIEIGSGLGGMAMYIARHRADVIVEGVEIAPLPWFISKLRSRIGGSAAVFSLGDYQRIDFAAYDLVFAYLSPAAMPDLWLKCKKEMRPDSLLVSYEFDVPGVSPTQIITLNHNMPAIYVWRMAK